MTTIAILFISTDDAGQLAFSIVEQVAADLVEQRCEELLKSEAHLREVQAFELKEDRMLNYSDDAIATASLPWEA